MVILLLKNKSVYVCYIHANIQRHCCGLDMKYCPQHSGVTDWSPASGSDHAERVDLKSRHIINGEAQWCSHIFMLILGTESSGDEAGQGPWRWYLFTAFSLPLCLLPGFQEVNSCLFLHMLITTQDSPPLCSMQ